MSSAAMTSLAAVTSVEEAVARPEAACLAEEVPRSSFGCSFAVTDENPSFAFSEGVADWPVSQQIWRRPSSGGPICAGALSHPADDSPLAAGWEAPHCVESDSPESRDVDLQLSSRLRHRPSPLQHPPGLPDYPAWLTGLEDGTVSPQPLSNVDSLEGFPPPYPALSPKKNNCAGCSAALGWHLLASGKEAHYCLLCGNAFCGSCSSFWTLLPHMGYREKQRTCKACHVRATGNQRPQPEEPQRRGRTSSSPTLFSWLPAKLFPFLRTSAEAHPHTVVDRTL